MNINLYIIIIAITSTVGAMIVIVGLITGIRSFITKILKSKSKTH